MNILLRSALLVTLTASVLACRSEETTTPTTTSTASGGSGGASTTTTSTGGSGGTGTTSSTSSTSTTSSSTTGTGGTGTGGTSTGTGGTGTGGTGTGGTGTGGTGGSTTSTGGAGPCMPSMPTEIVQAGQGSLLLRGMVVTPDVAFQGEVLITGDTIACVAATCAPPANTTIVDTHGTIFPGLIDTHNHILFDIFDETDWAPTQSYNNHNQWTNETRYGAMVDAKQYLNGEGSSFDFGCEMNKYGELKGLVAGTTSIVGAANPTNKGCYGTLARTIDQTPNGGLGADKIQVATLFPNATSANNVCNNFTSGSTDAYVIHVAEGVDQTALNEFSTLNTITTPDGCLLSPKTTIVHGAALGDAELTTMAQNQMSLVWSPRSNIFLYGAGTDFTKTAKIPLALSKGINVALAPDWSMGGSQNLLDELRFADLVDNTAWGDVISKEMLVKMVTTNAARALGLGNVLGSLDVGKKADVMVVSGDGCSPYDALLSATPVDVKMVLVGGVVLYGDAAVKSLGPAAPGCEDLDVCGTSKFACVATTGGTATNKFGQSLAQIKSALDTAIADYDALNLTQWKFAPITPIVRCPP